MQHGNSQLLHLCYLLLFFLISQTIGKIEIIMIMAITGNKYLSIPGTMLPKKYPDKVSAKDQTNPPIRL